MREIMIEGDDLDTLLNLLAEGGYTETPAYRMRLRVYGTGSDQVAVQVNDSGWTYPLGRLERTVGAA